MSGALKLFLIAGEPSGDRLGAALMAGLRVLVPGVGFQGVGFQGVGGPLMQAEGLQSLFPMEELSVMSSPRLFRNTCPSSGASARRRRRFLPAGQRR